jgi:hypothetical protein
MTESAKLAQIGLLGELILQARLAELERAARARQQSLDHLGELDRPIPETDLPAAVAAEVALRYQLWADQRRSDINLALARQTLAWVEARQAAACAFGRDQALGRLTGRKR